VILLKQLVGAAYKTNLENQLLDGFDKENRRVDFRQTCGFYCSHLVNIGYSKPHIDSLVMRTFFQAPIRRVGARTLRRFFKLFNGKPKKYAVYAGVSQEFGVYLKKLFFEVKGHGEVPTAVSNALHLGNDDAANLPFIAIRKIDAYDDYGAIDEA
jgi:hypothetical protein